MIPTTPKQRELLDFLEYHIKEKRYCPSYDEIRISLNLKSIATVHKHITNLENKGLIRRIPGKARTIEIVHESQELPRFVLSGVNRLWDRELKCYWRQE